MKLVITGDSHVIALSEAYRQNPAAYPSAAPGRTAVGRMFPFPTVLEPFFERQGDRIILSDPDRRARLKNLIGREEFVAGDPNIYLFSMALTTTVLVRLSVWHKFRPWRAAQKKTQSLSDTMMAKVSWSHSRHVIGFFTALQELGIRFAAVAPPPPRSDTPLAKTLDEAGYLEIDRLHRAAISDVLTGMGIAIVPTPQAAFDPQKPGFLRPEFCKAGDDRFHANAGYGQLMLPAVLAMGATLVAEAQRATVAAD